MFQSLVPLLVLLAALYVWQNALRAREVARGLCQDLCVRANVQLLDQTVALRGLRLKKVPSRGFLLRRDYGFEFSVDGKDRHRGSLSIVDDQVLAHNLPIAAEAFSTTSNVISLPVAPRTTRH